MASSGYNDLGPAPNEKKHTMTRTYNIRLVLEQVDDTDDPHVLGYPETEELDEVELFSTNVESAGKLEFADAKQLCRYLHVEKGQISQLHFNKIGDQFITTAKNMRLSVSSVRFVLKSLIDSFEETVKAGEWRRKK